MKNKKTTYFMLPFVLAIWGVIGWKVYAAFGKNVKNNVSSNSPAEKNKAEPLADTVSLIANYRDPFLDKTMENSPQKFHGNKISKVEIAKTIPVVPISVWPKIMYHGLIKRSGDKRTVGFLSVDGKSYFVQGGAEVNAVKVGKMWNDSVEIFWGKEKKVVRK
jgi:hypothetical protein